MVSNSGWGLKSHQGQAGVMPLSPVELALLVARIWGPLGLRDGHC